MNPNLDFARTNRKAMTEAEVRVWVRIRRSQLGVRFRRQVTLGSYIADFACLALKLVVEIDGAQHWESAYDGERDAYLRLHGWTVLRLSTVEVLADPDWAAAEIAFAVARLQGGSR